MLKVVEIEASNTDTEQTDFEKVTPLKTGTSKIRSKSLVPQKTAGFKQKKEQKEYTMY